MKRKKNNKSTIFSFYGNCILLITKGIIGVIFNNQAFIADTLNSAGDIFGSLMAFIGGKISSEPADEDHNYGHGKADYLYSLYIGIGMIFASLLVIVKSIEAIFNGTINNFSIFLIIGSLITLTIKLFLYFYTKYEYKKTENYLLLSLCKDHRNDSIISLGTLISAIFSFYNIYIMDSIIGILISLWIIYTGYNILRDSKKVLMDEGISKAEEDYIISLIKRRSNELELERISSIPIGNKYVIVLTINVEGTMTVNVSHELTKKLQSSIIKHNSNIDRVIIHVNPKD